MKKNIYSHQLLLIIAIFLSAFTGYSQIENEEFFIDEGDSVNFDSINIPIELLHTQCELIDSIVNFALQQRHKPYHYGTAGPHSFDCSGLVYYTFNHFNIKLGRSSRDQYQNGISVRREEIRKGDLVFYIRKGRIGHVGLVVSVDSNQNFLFVHASTHNRGICVDRSDRVGYGGTFYGIRRIVDCDTPIVVANVSASVSSMHESEKIVYYKIKKGDTLLGIAKRYHVTVSDLKKWNHLKSDFIREGEKMKISKK